MKRIFPLVLILLGMSVSQLWAQSTPPNTPIPTSCPTPSSTCTWTAAMWNQFFAWTGGKVDLSSLSANAVAYGADPTGVADSTTAINNALATGRSVFLPSGTYLVSSSLNNSYGTCLFGAGPHNTIIHVTSAFSPASVGVIVMANTAVTGRAQGGCVHDLQVEFDQPTTQTSRANFASLGTCTTVSGGTGCKYPPAIYDTYAGDRVWCYNLTIAGAWTGIYFGATGDVHNVAFWLDNIEIGALNVGLSADGAQDWTHINGFHFWPFGIGGNTQNDVFGDGNTQSANFGRQDGLQVNDFVSQWGEFVATPDASGSETGWRIANANIGGHNGPSILIQAGFNITFVNLATGNNSTGIGGGVEVTGGLVHIADSFIVTDTGPTFGAIYQTGGNLEISNTTFYQNPTETSVYEAAGALYMTGNYFANGNSVSVPLINSVGGLINATGNSAAFTATGGVAIAVTTDNLANLVAGNTFGHLFTYQFPCTNCTSALGVYQTGAPGAGVMVNSSWSTGNITSSFSENVPLGLFSVNAASSLDHIIVNAVGLNGGGTVNVVLLDCGTDPACATTPTTLSSGTIAADGAVSLPITASQLPGPSYVAWEITGGTFSAVNLTFGTTYHVN